LNGPRGICEPPRLGRRMARVYVGCLRDGGALVSDDARYCGGPHCAVRKGDIDVRAAMWGLLIAAEIAFSVWLIVAYMPAGSP